MTDFSGPPFSSLETISLLNHLVSFADRDHDGAFSIIKTHEGWRIVFLGEECPPASLTLDRAILSAIARQEAA